MAHDLDTEGYWYYKCTDQSLNQIRPQDVKDGVAKGTFTEIAVALKKRGFDIHELKSIQQEEYDRLRQLSIKFAKNTELKQSLTKKPIALRRTWYTYFKTFFSRSFTI